MNPSSADELFDELLFASIMLLIVPQMVLDIRTIQSKIKSPSLSKPPKESPNIVRYMKISPFDFFCDIILILTANVKWFFTKKAPNFLGAFTILRNLVAAAVAEC